MHRINLKLNIHYYNEDYLSFRVISNNGIPDGPINVVNREILSNRAVVLVN